MNSSRTSNDDPAGDSLVEPRVERLSRPAQLILLLWLLSALAYLGWRATTLNPAAPIFSWLIYGAELLAFAGGLLTLFMLGALRRRGTPTPDHDLSVDLMIIAGDEPVDRIRHCLLAARNVDYPHGTWLLDDGHRPERRALAAELGARYLPRPPVDGGANARLNQALRQSNASHVAIFRADHAPKRSFLDDTLGHFRDPRVAFVQAAQDFLNLEALAARRPHVLSKSGQSLFFRVIQRGRDCWNAALYCGSCVVFRRASLDAIGGFPADRPGADLDTSLAVHKAGFHSIYVAQPLAFGIAPASLRAAETARQQRDQGALRVLLQEALFLRGSLSLPQRLVYLGSTLGSLDGWQQALCYAAPVWMLLSGQLPLLADAGLFLALFLPSQLLRVLGDDELKRGLGHWQLVAAQNMARFVALIRDGHRQPLPPPAATLPAPKPPLSIAVRWLWPQLLVASMNLIALLAGCLAWSRGSEFALPTAGLIAAATWACLNIAIAGHAMRRSIDRPEDHRQARRFAIPLPAVIRIDGSEVTMTVDNISSTGARLYGDFPNRMKPGDEVAGELYLPGDTVPFAGRIAALLKPDKRSEDGQYHAAIGIAFDWADRRAEDRLSLFLHGSDLHWQFQRPALTSDTARERITALFHKGPTDPLAGKHWATICYDADGETGHGLISVASSPGPRVIVTSHRLPLSEPLQASKFSRRQPQGLRLTPRRELAQLSTPTSTLYLTEVKAAPMLEPMRSGVLLPSTTLLRGQMISDAPS